MRKEHFVKTICLVAMALSIFSAKAQTATVPYSCGFENATENAYWRFRYSATNKWIIGPATANGGTKSMYVTNDNGISNSSFAEYNAVYAYRSIAITAGMYSISYDYKMGGTLTAFASSNQYLRAFLVPHSTQLPSDSAMLVMFRNNRMPTGAIPIDGGGNGRVPTSSVWTTYVDNYAQVPSTDTFNLLFAWYTSGIGFSEPPAVDNINITPMTCPIPYNVVTTDLTDSIMVDWTDFNNTQPSQGWIVEYKPYGAPASAARTAHANAKPFYLTSANSIVPNTQYEIRVCAQCDTNDTSAYSAMSLVTYKMLRPVGCFVYDTLTLPHVRCYYGTWNNNTVVPNHISGPFQNQGVVDSGPHDYYRSRHTVHRDVQEYDSCTGYQIPTIYPGNSIYSSFHQQIKYLSSVRLGRVGGRYDAQAVSYQFHVDSNAADFMMINYAFILAKGPTSSMVSFPHLVIEILDTNNQVIDQLADVAIANMTNQTTNTYFTNWTQLGVNMGPYHGRDVRLCFSTYNCGTCTHVASYAYLIPEYRNANLVTIPDSSKSNTTTFAAPEGFRYKWYLLSNPTDIIDTVQTGAIPNGEYFACELTDAFGHKKVLRSHAYNRLPHSAFTCNVRAIDCDTKEIKLVNNSYMTADNGFGTLINDIEDYYWSFNNGEKVCMLNNPTITTTDTGMLKITLYTSTTNNTVLDSASQIVDLSYVPFRTSIYDTIDYGESYSFAGMTLQHNGIYDDTLVSSLGCDSIVTLYLCVNGDLSLNNADLEQVKVYPNPVGNRLVVSGCEVTNSAIFEGAGKVVLAFGKETQLDVSKLPAGIYTIRIETPAGTVMRKFVKK